MSRKHTLVFYWLPLIVWLAFIFTLSSQTGDEAVGHSLQGFGFYILRKVFHGLEYAVMTVLMYRVLERQTGLDQHNLASWSVLLAFLYGFTDEAHQAFVPGRDGQIGDAFVDLAGGFFGLAAWLKLRKIAEARRLKSGN